MKRYKKKEMLETVSMLEKANDTIGKVKTSANQMNVIDSLTQCQEFAILLGTYIDTLGEKTSYLVRVLEDYCENIYQISISLSDDNLCRKLSKKIMKQLSILNNGIRYDLPNDKKEVVFLPYNATMWDSLESVWKAADADENCDAYVIPIPYFDKNPDGSFREMFYEGDQYPDYVPITNYEQYDFEERRPDMIFIHNPYDEHNYVTSVHPFFFSKNLKQFTEMLVYIPYFVLDEIKPDNHSVIKGIKHFCTTSGVFNSDKVVVQSEDIRQVYINVLTEAIGNTKGVRKYWEDKILGLGSPKVDKVLSTRKEDLTIPDKWKKIIKKPDGSWKKIIFYNTSIAALLESGEQILKKIERVFSVIKANKDEIALLWRPHPLIESTLISMRPQLWEEYKKIVDKYLLEDWGIYDVSYDLSRAIEISDAYFGDPSSVVVLYNTLKKPIMLQNDKISYDGKHDYEKLKYNLRDLFFWDAYCDKENVWISTISYNCLLKINRIDGACKIISFFEEEENYRGLHNQIVPYKNYLIFIPGLARNIAICNVNNGNMKYISLVREKSHVNEVKISGTVLIKDKLWLFPEYSSQNLLILDLEKCQIYEQTLFLELIKKYDFKYSYPAFGMAVVEDYTVWIPIKRTNNVIKYNCVTSMLEVFEFPDKKIKINSIERYDSGLLITLIDESRIIKWNFENGKYEDFILEVEWDRDLFPFSRVLYLDKNKFMVLPAHSENIFIVKNGVQKVIDYPKGFYWVDDFKAKWSKMVYCRKDRDFVYIMPAVGNMLLIYDINKEKIEGVRCEITDKKVIDAVYERAYITKKLKYLIETGCYVKENNEYNLEHLLNIVETYTSSQKKIIEIKGQLIYQRLQD